jgi:transcriptional regulator with GAF, ATPase, and Fis domain
MIAETADDSSAATRSSSKASPGVAVVFSGSGAVFLPRVLDGEPLVVGRVGALGSLLSDDRLSRHHARITRSADGWTVEDLDSRNGTFVDGVRVQREVRVPSLRVVRMAGTLLVPCDDASTALPPSVEGETVMGAALRRAMASVARAAGANETFVVHGETGTGKELAARWFHKLGPNARGPFVAVNCAALPEGLAERLLFGAKRGAYSGATADAAGNLQAADRGVLFLDEAGDLDLGVQAKLLRVLETREVVPLGASHGTPVDVRVCLATHEDLRTEVAAGRFRADLYHRIAPPEVMLPPLRARLDEIAQHVVREVAHVSPGLKVPAQLVEACLLRHWPGNVRELRRNLRIAAGHAAAEGSDGVRLEHLPANAGQPIVESGSPAASDAEAERPRRAYVRWSETISREDIQRALSAHGGNVSLAARSLRMQRSQLYREMARLGVNPEDARD